MDITQTIHGIVELDCLQGVSVPWIELHWDGWKRNQCGPVFDLFWIINTPEKTDGPTSYQNRGSVWALHGWSGQGFACSRSPFPSPTSSPRHTPNPPSYSYTRATCETSQRRHVGTMGIAQGQHVGRTWASASVFSVPGAVRFWKRGGWEKGWKKP